MFDNGLVPGRNDACWCGSGKKYKKCHSAFDERLERLWEEGWEVLPRTLYKTPADIEGIKRSAAINVGVLDYVGEHIAAGMTTNQIDQMIYDYTVEHGGTPADLNYEGYPKSVCTSINDVVCHGIPCDTDVLHEGDIINVDCSTILDGYFSDSSRMFCIGEVSAERQRLVDVTRASVEAGLAAVKPWLPLSVMAEAVQKTVETLALAWCASTADTALARSSTRTRLWALPPRRPMWTPSWPRAWSLPSSPWSTPERPTSRLARAMVGACAPRTAAIRPSARYSSW